MTIFIAILLIFGGLFLWALGEDYPWLDSSAWVVVAAGYAMLIATGLEWLLA